MLTPTKYVIIEEKGIILLVEHCAVRSGLRSIYRHNTVQIAEEL
jgi:hypothetical protein